MEEDGKAAKGMLGEQSDDMKIANSNDLHGKDILEKGHDKNYEARSLFDEGEVRDEVHYQLNFQRVTVPAWQTAVPSWTAWSHTTSKTMFA